MNAFSASDLCQALDGRSVSASSSDWRIEVYGMFEHQGSCWAQMALRGKPDHSVAVRIGPQDTSLQVLAALSSWFAEPFTHGGPVLHLGSAWCNSSREAGLES